MDTTEQRTEAPEKHSLGPVILTSGEVCEVLKIEPYQLAYLLETKQIPLPRKTLLGRRLYFTEQDLQRIRNRLKAREIRARLRSSGKQNAPSLPGAD